MTEVSSVLEEPTNPPVSSKYFHLCNSELGQKSVRSQFSCLLSLPEGLERNTNHQCEFTNFISLFHDYIIIVKNRKDTKISNLTCLLNEIPSPGQHHLFKEQPFKRSNQIIYLSFFLNDQSMKQGDVLLFGK